VLPAGGCAGGCREKRAGACAFLVTDWLYTNVGIYIGPAPSACNTHAQSPAFSDSIQ